MDIYASIESVYEGRLIKETIHPCALFLVSCKSTRTKIDKSHVAEWLSISRDILHDDENVIDGVEMIAIVSKQGFTPDAIRFARANPITTYDYKDTEDLYKSIVRALLILFEQHGPTDFKQVFPAVEDVTYCAENLRIDLLKPNDIKFPKSWQYCWLQPDSVQIE